MQINQAIDTHHIPQEEMCDVTCQQIVTELKDEKETIVGFY